MTCNDASTYVSALHDGLKIPPEAARHIENCQVCRERLSDYAAMGAELRLAASRAQNMAAAVPPPLLDRVRSVRRKARLPLFGSVLVPRAALAAAALAIILLVPAGWTLVRAQSGPLWFEYELGPKAMVTGRLSNEGKTGFKETGVWLFVGERANSLAGHISRVGYRVAIKSIEHDTVTLDLACHDFGYGNNSPEHFVDDMKDKPTSEFVYKPGRPMEIPCEGGYTLILNGEILDHQPQLAWHMPVEPSANQLVVTSPVFLENGRVVADLEGLPTIADGRSEGALISAPGVGEFTIALRKFGDAFEAEANWGQLRFDMDGRHYLLAAGSPITGGEQPHKVWIGFEPKPVAQAALGAKSLPGS